MKFSTVTLTHYQYVYYVGHLVRHILPNIVSTSSPQFNTDRTSTTYHNIRLLWLWSWTFQLQTPLTLTLKRGPNLNSYPTKFKPKNVCLHHSEMSYLNIQSILYLHVIHLRTHLFHQIWKSLTNFTQWALSWTYVYYYNMKTKWECQANFLITSNDALSNTPA